MENLKLEIELKNFTVNSGEDIYYIMQLILKREQKQFDKDREHFWVIALNNANKILNIELVSIGSINEVLVQPMDVLQVPISKKALGVILVHNHPSGRLEPSENDKNVTERLIHSAKLLGIKVCDHVIITENSYYSFASSGLLERLEESSRYMFIEDFRKQEAEETQERIDYLIKEHEKEVQKSLEQGIEKGKLKVAKRLLSLGMDTSTIIKATELTEAELLNIIV
jgi:DNA repair protein RadC